MLNQTITLSQEQRLQMVLAPHLRQSLEMLQLPVLELRTLIRQELEKNPTLEESPLEFENVEIEPGSSEPEEQQQELDFDQEFETLARLDDEWREYFFQDESVHPYTPSDEEKRRFMLDSLPQRESLQEHLLKQLNLAGLSEEDRRIGELIVGSINDDGYLTIGIEELAQTSGFEVEHIREVLGVVQNFNPVGVGAADLRECLLLQIDRLGRAEPLAEQIIRHHLDQLAARKFQDIARALKVSPSDVQQAADFIGTLEPKPGRAYSTEVSSYVLPEVIVHKIEGEYIVILNNDQLPHLRISRHYRRLIHDKETSQEVKSYIRDRVRSGAFLIKSIYQRQKTIYKIACEIVRVQADFLDHGVSRLKPLTMAEVAGVVGVHETTVSRAVAAKYMQTPIGTYEMKYFFTPGLKTDNGSDVSNTAVKDMIATLVAAEDPKKPFSDNEIMQELQTRGIQIARRTIAKYRLMLRIPSSNLRRSF